MEIKDTTALSGLSESQLATEHKSADEQINAILNEIGDDSAPADSKLSDVEKLEKYLTEIEKVVQGKRESGESIKGARERAEARRKNLGMPVHRPGQNAGDSHEAKTYGEKFVKEIEGFLSSLKGADNTIREQKRIDSPSVPFNTMLKSIITGSSAQSAGALVVPDRYPVITDRDPFRPLTLRDIITIGETTSDTVDYAVITGHNNNAAPVAEATSGTDNSGMPNQSDLATDLKVTNVKDISHYVTMTKRALADAGQIKMYVDNFLMFGLGDKVERLAITGDGIGDNFLGVMNTPGIGHQAFDTDILKTVRKARTQCTNAQVQPNAILMSPNTWEGFDLEKDGQGRYYFGGPSVLGNARLWGTTAIENVAVPDNKAIIADWRYAVLFDRLAAELTMSDSPGNYFLKKLVAVMGSLRAAFAVLFPGAFIEIDLTAPAQV